VASHREQILELTRLLRDGVDPFWIRLRSLLNEKGVAPSTSILADCFPDDTSFEFGVIVTFEGRVFQFGFDYLHRSVEDGTLSEWVELTDRHSATPYHAEVAEALALRTR
jgi:hypothetical protein